MNIWIVQGSRGQYDEYCSWAHKAFYSKEAAQAWVERQPEINYAALEALYALQANYTNELSTEGIETDQEWEAFYLEEERLVRKATEEIQAEYPNADLMMSYDFNGYYVVEQPIELEEI